MTVMVRRKERILFIAGPTAIGKTRLAVRLARKLNGEIISADSMQAYKKMALLSQAPGLSERRGVTHHLVGFLEPSKEYSVAGFITRAKTIIASILKRGKVPIVAGGSGLYIKGLIDGLFPSPKRDLKFRKDMELFAMKRGAKRLHDKLLAIDPVAAARIHVNDRRRIIRALEIYKTSLRTMTELKLETKGLKDKYDIKIYGLIKPRADIYSSINRRVDKMFRDGLAGEVKRLKGVRLSRTAGAILGYKEAAGYIDGSYDEDTAKELLKKNTRRFAKRQLTWFRADERIRWFDVSELSDKAIISKIVKQYSC